MTPVTAVTVFRVTVDNGPSWVQHLIAFGTVGAALFAGWAALSARNSTAEARALIKLERSRDERAEEEAHWRQARRLSIEQMIEPGTLDDGRSAVDTRVVVTNLSGDPLLRSRLKIMIGSATWGPTLIGTLRPGQPVQLIVRLIQSTPLAPTDEVNAYARVNDVQGIAWIVDARGNVAQDDPAGLQRWIEEGAVAAARPMTPEERGTIDGAIYDPSLSLEEWREQFQVIRAVVESAQDESEPGG
jgi:hypothetical protein